MKKLIRTVAILAALWSSAAQAGDDEIVVIVNKANPATAMAKGDLRPIFQTTKTTWPGGDKILPLNQPDNDATRKGFDAAVLGLDPERVARYWVDRKIRGGDPPPKNIPSGSAVLKIVSAKSEAIGYVKSTELNGSVKVVARIRNGEVKAP
jgi:ABC-type phosphate transport system substrate-binding protein